MRWAVKFDWVYPASKAMLTALKKENIINFKLNFVLLIGA